MGQGLHSWHEYWYNTLIFSVVKIGVSLLPLGCGGDWPGTSLCVKHGDAADKEKPVAFLPQIIFPFDHQRMKQTDDQKRGESHGESLKIIVSQEIMYHRVVFTYMG